MLDARAKNEYFDLARRRACYSYMPWHFFCEVKPPPMCTHHNRLQADRLLRILRAPGGDGSSTFEIKNYQGNLVSNTTGI